MKYTDREVIKMLIEKDNTNISKLGRLLGKSKNAIWNLINRNTSHINQDDLIRIANYLDYDLVLVPKSRSENCGGYILKPMSGIEGE